MLGLSGRAVAFYAAVTFPFALFSYFRDHTSLDAAEERRRLRRALVPTDLAPLHVLFPLTALAATRDATQLATTPAQHAATRHRVRLAALAGVCSVVSFVVLGRVVAE